MMCCMPRALTVAALCASLFAGAGCTKNIPNTTVKDTPENRQVITFMENYRNAVESRDVGALLAMAHPQYLSLIHISEPTRLNSTSRMPSSA